MNSSTTDKKDTFNPKLVHLLDCPECHFITRSIDQYLDHVHVHHSDKEINFQVSECETCKLKATNEDFLDEHTQFNHGPDCKWRPLTFVSMNLYNYDSSTECKFCTAILPNTEALHCHYHSYHRINNISSYLIFKMESKFRPQQVISDICEIKLEPEVQDPVISNIVSVASSRTSTSPPRLSPQKPTSQVIKKNVQCSIPELYPERPTSDNEDSDCTTSMRELPRLSPRPKCSRLIREAMDLHRDIANMTTNHFGQPRKSKSERKTANSLSLVANNISLKARRSATNCLEKSPIKRFTRRSLNDNTSNSRYSTRRSIQQSELKNKSVRTLPFRQTRSKVLLANDSHYTSSNGFSLPKSKQPTLSRKKRLSENSEWVASSSMSDSEESTDDSSSNSSIQEAPVDCDRNDSVTTASTPKTNPSHECSICNKKIDSLTEMLDHFNRFHSNSKSKRIPSELHTQSISKEGTSKFHCHLCNKTFLRENGLVGHMIASHQLNKEGRPFKVTSLQSDFALHDTDKSDEDFISPVEKGKKYSDAVKNSRHCQLQLNQCSICFSIHKNCNEFLIHMDKDHQFSRERYSKTTEKSRIKILRPIVKLESFETMLQILERDCLIG